MRALVRPAFSPEGAAVRFNIQFHFAVEDSIELASKPGPLVFPEKRR